MNMRAVGKALCILLVLPLVACGGAQEPAATSTPEPPAAATLSPIATSPPPTTTPAPRGTATVAPSATPSRPVAEQVAFPAKDGTQLAGTLFGKGNLAVVLAHQGTHGADQTTWHPFAQLLAERGFAALAFDFRGMGQSAGTLSDANLAMDITAAIQFLRDRGYDRIVCAGASMGGTACIRAALDGELSGLIVLASTMRTGVGRQPLSVAPGEFADLALPKLFVTADKDSYSVVDHTKRMYELSPEPKSLHLLPGTVHGTDLFDTEAGDDLVAILLEFLESLRDEESMAPALLVGPEGRTGAVHSLACSLEAIPSAFARE